MTLTAAFRDRIERMARIGVVPTDSDEVRVQKVTLTLAAVTVTVLAVMWVGTYLVRGHPLSAAIPFVYQLASVASLIAFARTKDYRLLRFSQIVLMLLLPFLLQWSLGGYVASSAVSLWALVGVFGALFFYSARQAVPWFVAFVVLTVVSGLAARSSPGPRRRSRRRSSSRSSSSTSPACHSPPTSCSNMRSGNGTRHSPSRRVCCSMSCLGRSRSG